ncbi:MAG TPA: STAS domain-containing protein [Phycisphaerales bacterium]|nr:STAS domain-containing protein [Phycisphaerales bacterium]
MYTLDSASAASELVSVLDVAMVRPFAMVKVRPHSLREHQASLLREELADVVDHSCGRVLLRFSEGAELCASCLSELINESLRCDALGGRMCIVGLSRDMRRLLRDTGLDRRLHLVRETAEAMRHFDRRTRESAA